MPAWIQNKLTVVGSKRDLADFKAFVCKSPNKSIVEIERCLKIDRDNKNEVLLFDNIIPKPEIIRGEAGYSASEHSWEVKEWGCKWGAWDSIIEKETSRSLKYSFRTPENAPVPIISELTKKFPKLTIKLTYIAEVTGISGYVNAINGIVSKSR